MLKYIDTKKSHFLTNSNNNKIQYNIYSFSNNKNLENNKNYENELNLYYFIKQKNKFNIRDDFDEKGAKKFLLEKFEATMEINLNDEILTPNNKNEVDLPKKNLKEENNMQKKKAKNLSVQKEKSKKQKQEESSNFLKLFANDNKNDNDSNDNNFIYKFIIDNANESEDKFHKKLKKEIKKVETKKKLNKDKTNKNIIYNSLTFKQKEKRKYNSNIKSDKLENPFNFSETAKNLMITEGIEASSINNDDNAITDKLPIKTTDNTINKKENIKILGEQKIIEKKKIYDNIEINSDKESLFNLISDMY